MQDQFHNEGFCVAAPGEGKSHVKVKKKKSYNRGAQVQTSGAAELKILHASLNQNAEFIHLVVSHSFDSGVGTGLGQTWVIRLYFIYWTTNWHNAGRVQQW